MEIEASVCAIVDLIQGQEEVATECSEGDLGDFCASFAVLVLQRLE
jgi:hypothetical protein